MIYVFGNCELDTRQYVLRRAGRTIALSPKVFQVLSYLLAHHDRVISKQELCEQVWPNQFISDAALESTMRVVRQTLGDSGRTQQFIQTRRGHGYRIVVAVTVLQDSETETALPPPTTTEPLDDRIPLEPRPSPPHLEPEPDRTGLAALLDQLPPSAQSLLQAAAVIGSEVSFPLLQAVTGVPLETLAPRLAHLQTAGRLAEARRLPKLVYTFVPPSPNRSSMRRCRMSNNVSSMLRWLKLSPNTVPTALQT